MNLIEKNKKYIYIYKTTNIVNNRYYIGLHGTNNLKDGYLGSSKHLRMAIDKYGIKNFKKEILEFFDDYKSAIVKEKEIVDEKFVKNRITYNLEIGGAGGKIWSDKLKLKMSITKKGSKSPMEGKNHSKKSKLKMSNSRKGKMMGKDNPMHGKSVADFMTKSANKRRCKRISISNRKPKKNKEKYSIYSKKRFWIVNENNETMHCLILNDARLLSGKYKLGRKYK